MGRYDDLEDMAGCLVIGLLLVVGLVGIMFLVVPDPTIVIGPTPEEIEEHCQPVVAWILTETSRLGEAPPTLSAEMAERMSGQPYPWQYSRIRKGKPGSCVLQVGTADHGWPHPLYSYEWWPGRGWSWQADHSVTNEEAKRILEEHGYYGARSEEPPR